MRKIIASLALAALAACGGSDTVAGPPASLTGVWTLRTGNGGALPVVLQAGPPKLEVLDDSYSLNADGTYSESGHVRITNGTTVVTSSGSEIGSWVQSGSSVRLTPTTGTSAPYTASVTGNAMTFISGSVALIYSR